MTSQVNTVAAAGSSIPEESVEDLYENAPCGYLSTLPDGTLIKVNQTLLRWTGYTREELLGKRFQDLLTRGGRIFHETHYAPLLRMQGAVNEINLDLVDKAGHALPALLNSTLLKDAAGAPLLVRTTLFNITDRKKYERELVAARKKAEEATRAKADFLSMVSHEIRTPMNAIIGIAHLLQETSLSARQFEYLRLLKFSSENLLNLLNGILDFSKMEAGKATLEERTFNIRQLVYSTFYALSAKAEEKQLAVRVEVDERLPAHLQGDPVKLGQVLTNLLSNALKFTEKGSITVALRVEELHADSVCVGFRVTDTGIGIPRDRLAHVFEEFTQASSDIALKYGGTGLGLTISRKLVELHGGALTVESEQGAGSTFSFSLRLKIGQDLQESAGPSERLADPDALRGLRVLVAEDNTVNVFILTQFLRKWGVAVDVVDTGRKALEKLQAGPYDVAMMDLQMPELDGYEVTRTIRSHPEERLRRLPIIALSASTRIGLEDRLDSAGFTDFVSKPFKPEALFLKLALYGGRQPVAPGATPSREAPAQAERTALPLLELGLERFKELVGEEPQALVEITTMTISHYEQCRRDFRAALEAGSLEDFEFHTHKIQMTLTLLGAHGLRAALQQGSGLLARRERDPARIQAAIHAIHWELDAIVGFLKTELRKLEQAATLGMAS
jgi:PAS domain S-box-containing protein